MTIWITGFNISLDMVLQVENIDKYGRTHVREIKTIGSKGGNVFRALLSLAQHPHIITFTWGNSGKLIENMLYAISPSTLQIHNHHFTATHDRESRINTILLNNGKEELMSAPNPSIDKNTAKSFIQSVAKVIKPDDHLVITGSLPEGLEIVDMIPLIESVKENHIWIDLKGNHLIKAYNLAPRAIFKLNHIESHDLTERGILPDKLIVTSKDRVIANIDGQHTAVNIPPQTPVVNTIGAGDVFMASLVYERVIHGKPWEETLKWASARATASTLELGVAIWQEEKAKEIYNSITIYQPS